MEILFDVGEKVTERLRMAPIARIALLVFLFTFKAVLLYQALTYDSGREKALATAAAMEAAVAARNQRVRQQLSANGPIRGARLGTDANAGAGMTPQRAVTRGQDQPLVLSPEQRRLEIRRQILQSQRDTDRAFQALERDARRLLRDAEQGSDSIGGSVLERMRMNAERQLRDAE